MDNTDNKSEGENTLFDINPTDKENDLLQPINDEKNNMDIANDNQPSNEVQSSNESEPLTKKRARIQTDDDSIDDDSMDEVQSMDESIPLTKKPKLGGNRSRKIKSKKLPLKKTRRKIHPKKRTSSTIKHNKLKHKQKRNTRRKR
jgi:hypothetical protein